MKEGELPELEAKASETQGMMPINGSNTNLSVFEFMGNSLDDITNFVKGVVERGLCKYKPNEISKAVNAVVYGIELGIPPMMALNHVFEVNGLPSVDVHVATFLAEKNNIIIECDIDFKPKFNVYRKEIINNEVKSTYVGRSDYYVNINFEKGEVPGKEPVDTGTVVKFTKYVKTPLGIKEIVFYSEYTVSEANNAELLTKANWKHLRAMLRARATLGGSRFFASSAIQGHYSPDEANFSNTADILYDEDGNVLEILEKKK